LPAATPLRAAITPPRLRRHFDYGAISLMPLIFFIS
jgi:hypothetical protein